jgi:hypothetical protein
VRSGWSILVVAAAFGLAACGGDGSEDSKGGAASTKATPAPAPSVASPAPGPKKAAFIRKADKVCRAARAKLTPIRAKILPASQGTDPDVVFQRYAKLTGQAATVYSQTATQLGALTPPARDAAEIDRLNGLVEQIAGIEHQISEASAQHDSTQVKQLNASVTRVFGAYQAGAQKYGFKVCGTASALQRRGNR